MIARTFALSVLVGVCAAAQSLWKEPPPSTASAWTWGPGGQEMAPRPPFAFVKERLGGGERCREQALGGEIRIRSPYRYIRGEIT